jgi:murein DD-endopeptidase MepM/ murein hydrolase activator NlpD
MTQHHKSAHKNSYYGSMSKRFASRLPAQSLCLLSSVSILGSGFVNAQTESSSIDNIVPTIENSQPSAGTSQVQKEVVIPEIAKPKSDFSARQANLKKRLNIQKASNSNTVKITKPKGENTQPGASVSETDSRVKKLPEVEQSVNNSQNTAKDTENKLTDYNNAYIDPTDYKNANTGNYEPPSSVVVTGRSSGCSANVTTGQNSCAKPSQTPALAQSKESVPTWLKKSETAKLPLVAPALKTITANSKQPDNLAGVVANTVNKISQTPNNWQSSRNNTSSHNKAGYNANGFIPSPSEFSTTRVSSTPIAPQVGSLPAPMMEGNVAPRPSMVSYDFSLASVLPEVPYTNTLAYRGGGGIVFPLSVAAPITSLFGWRVHPITGDHRFHAGTDIGAPTGTPILAAARGQVETASWIGGYGLAVIINHSSAQQTLYGHMSEILVQPGQVVEPGTVIGRVGSTGNSTGPHLHFEVRHLTQNGWVAVDPGVQLQGGLSQLLGRTQGTRTAQAR